MAPTDRMRPRTARTSADDDFGRFCRRGDMDALGRVFDATAPALYHLALHLRPSSAMAEDLVQSTFVTAIESSTRFESGRRVFPWLLGILTNHARELYRIERHAAVPADPVEATTPLDAVSHREVREHLRTAIDGLAEPYRSVVRRFLQDGLTPREISHELCRSPNTVRVQLKRGLGFIRRGLPHGLAPGAMVLDTGERGLGVVRERILAHARGFVTVSAATSVMPSGIVIALVVVLFAAPMLAVLAPSTQQRGGDAVSNVSASADGDRHGEADAGRGATETARTEIAGPAVPNAPERAPARITGRAVDAATGLPLDGLAVEVLSTRQLARSGAGVSLRAWTDRQGRFRFELAPDPKQGGYHVRVAAGEPSRVRVQRSYDEIAPGEHVDLGAVPVSAGAVVAGRVVDLSGLPVRDATLRLDCPQRRIVPVVDGEFRTTRAVPEGRWPVTVRGMSVLSPPVLAVPAAAPVEVRVQRRPSIRGVVVDRRGCPASNVFVRREGRERPLVQTDGEGRFELFAAGSEPRSPTVHLVAEAWTIRPGSPSVAAHWNGSDVRIVVHRALRLPIRVVDESGEPVTRFAVSSAPGVEHDGIIVADADLPPRLLPPGVRHRGVHAGGRLDVGGLRPGWNLLRVLPDAAELLPSDAIPVRVAEESRETVIVRLRASARLRVRVVDRQRRPVLGARVELLAPDPPVRYAPVPEREVLDAADTGEDGTAVLRHRGGTEPTRLRVTAAGSATLHRDVDPRMRDVEVVAPEPGRLAGRFTGPTCVRRIGLRPAGAGPEITATVRSGGSFRAEDLEPGRYDVVGFFIASRFVPGHADSRFVEFERPLAVVDVRSGRETPLVLDPAFARPGRIRGRLTLAGNAPPASWLYLERVGASSGGEVGPFPVDGAGRFDVGDLVPGSYGVRWSRAGRYATDVQQSVRTGIVVDVEGGATSAVSADLPGSRLELALVGAPDTPLRLRWRHAVAGLRTDGQGRAVLGFVPAGTVDVEIAERPRLRLSSFEIRPRDEVTRITRHVGGHDR